MYSVNLILATQTDRCTGWVEEPSLTKARVLYSELMISMSKDNEKENRNEHKLKQLRLRVIKLKRLLVETFSKHCSSGLFILKFHLLDHVVDGLHVFETLFVLDVSLFEQ